MSNTRNYKQFLNSRIKKLEFSETILNTILFMKQKTKNENNIFRFHLLLNEQNKDFSESIKQNKPFRYEQFKSHIN